MSGIIQGQMGGNSCIVQDNNYGGRWAVVTPNAWYGWSGNAGTSGGVSITLGPRSQAITASISSGAITLTFPEKGDFVMTVHGAEAHSYSVSSTWNYLPIGSGTTTVYNALGKSMIRRNTSANDDSYVLGCITLTALPGQTFIATPTASNSHTGQTNHVYAQQWNIVEV